MPELPKTYWNNLSTRARAVLVRFCNTDIPHCEHCPNFCHDVRDCDEICTALFQRAHFIGGHCPCIVYGPENAMAALEKAIADSGWEED